MPGGLDAQGFVGLVGEVSDVECADDGIIFHGVVLLIAWLCCWGQVHPTCETFATPDVMDGDQVAILTQSVD